MSEEKSVSGDFADREAWHRSQRWLPTTNEGSAPVAEMLTGDALRLNFGRPEFDSPGGMTEQKKAHAPTRVEHLDARQAAYREDRALWFPDHENSPEIATNAFFRGWDAAVSGGFRRPEIIAELTAAIEAELVGDPNLDGRVPNDATLTAWEIRKVLWRYCDDASE